MAVTPIKPNTTPRTPTVSVRPSSSPLKTFTLPTAPNEPVDSISKCVWLFYGETKIGKTLLASQFEDVFFFFTEMGGKGFRHFGVVIDSWEEFVGYMREVVKDPRFKTITVDTFDRLYDLCLDYVCEREDIKDPSEQAYGKGWRAVRREFETIVDEFLKAGKGVIFISHAADRTFQTRSGGEYTKLVPSAAKQATKLALAIADVTLYMGYYGQDRYMTLAGSDSLEAGTRLKNCFWAKDKSRVHSIPAGKDETESYKNLVAAFENQQPTNGKPAGATILTDTPKLTR